MKISNHTQSLVFTCFFVSLISMAAIIWQFDLHYKKQQQVTQLGIESNEIKHLQGMFNHFMTTIDLFFNSKQSYLVSGAKKQHLQILQRLDTIVLARPSILPRFNALSKQLNIIMDKVEKAAINGPVDDFQWNKQLEDIDKDTGVLIVQYNVIDNNVNSLVELYTQQLEKQSLYLAISFLASTLLTLGILVLLGFFNSRKIIKPINNLIHITQLNKKDVKNEFLRAPQEIKIIAESLANYLQQLSDSKIKAEQDKKKITQQNIALQQSINTINKTRQQLVQSEKLASLGQLAAGIAHEINNPISYVISNQGSLDEYVNDINNYIKLSINPLLTDQERQQAYANTEMEYILDDLPKLVKSTKEGLARVQTIIQDLKVYTHNDTEQYQEISASELFNQSLNLAQSSISDKVEIVKNIKNQCAIFYGVKSRMIQVIVNLLVNANDAITGEGTIWVCSEYCKISNKVILTVKDSGKGIKPEHLEKVFDPFFTTKQVGKGTGLGLHICQTLVQAQKGELTVTSQFKKGACFKLSFDCASQLTKSA